MKRFTIELMDLYGSDDPATARAGEAEWDRRCEEYEAYLQTIRLLMPPGVREASGLLLHDARVFTVARQGSSFIMVLKKDIPPRDIVVLTYDLVGEPFIDKEGYPAQIGCPVMNFEYDELELVEEGGRTFFRQSILFSNGWEVRLDFADVRVVLADPVFTGTETIPLARSA